MPELNAHDLFFRGIFCNPARAAEVLRWALPKHITQHVEWTTLWPLRGEFIHEDLFERRRDLSFQARFNGLRIPLLTLLEHQSLDDTRMLLRILVYEAAIWDDWILLHPKRKHLPPLVCVVVSHDPGGWQGPKTLHDKIARSPLPLGQAGPQLEIFVLDLHELTDDQIASKRLHPQTKQALLLLKHGRDRKLRTLLLTWCDLLGKVLRSVGGRRAFQLCMRYILLVGHVKAEDMVEDLAPLGRTAGEIIMTEAERLMALGEKRGIEIGEKRGLQRGEKLGEKRGLQRGLQRGEKLGEKRGLQRGLAPTIRLFERRLGRPLAKNEQQTLHVRLDTLGPDRLADVVLDLSPEELTAWLADRNAT